jgi:hypothetical protein
LEVLILHDFKSFAPEVLILGGFKSLFPEVLILVGFRSFKLSAMEGFCEFLEVLISVDFKIFIINRSETRARRAETHEELLEVLVLREFKCCLAARFFPRAISAETGAARHAGRGSWSLPSAGFGEVSESGCLRGTPEDTMVDTNTSTILYKPFECGRCGNYFELWLTERVDLASETLTRGPLRRIWVARPLAATFAYEVALLGSWGRKHADYYLPDLLEFIADCLVPVLLKAFGPR